MTRIKSPLEGGWNQSDDIQASRQPPHVTGIEKGLKRKFLSITNNFFNALDEEELVGRCGSALVIRRQ